MLVAIAANTPHDDAMVNLRAARAPFFFLYDSADHVVEVVPNPFEKKQRSMGLRTADFLKTKGAAMVIAGRFGSTFTESLERAGIKQMPFAGAVRDAAHAAFGR